MPFRKIADDTGKAVSRNCHTEGRTEYVHVRDLGASRDAPREESPDASGRASDPAAEGHERHAVDEGTPVHRRVPSVHRGAADRRDHEVLCFF